jgi:hypothetical protein
MRGRRGEGLPGFERELRSPEVYLSRMGWAWLVMVAFFALGMVLWFAVGLGRAALLVIIGPMLLVRVRWERLLRDYSESMRGASQRPFSNRDWSLIGDALIHVVWPARPARSRAQSGHDGTGVRNLWLSALPLGLGAWVPIYAGVRRRNTSWCVQGAVWSGLVLVGWIFAVGHVRGTHSLAGALILLGWSGATVSAFRIHRAPRRGARAR